MAKSVPVGEPVGEGMAPPTTRRLEELDFYGNSLSCVMCPERNDVVVVLGQLCETLGLDYSSQLKKLKEKPWAKLERLPALARDGKVREVWVISHRAIPMWLSQLQAGKILPELADKIILYQLEAAEVLARHFLCAGMALCDLARLAGILVPALPALRELLALRELVLEHDRWTLGVDAALGKLEALANADGLAFVARQPEEKVPYSELRAMVQAHVETYARNRGNGSKAQLDKTFEATFSEWNGKMRTRLKHLAFNRGMEPMDYLEHYGHMREFHGMLLKEFPIVPLPGGCARPARRRPPPRRRKDSLPGAGTSFKRSAASRVDGESPESRRNGAAG